MQREFRSLYGRGAWSGMIVQRYLLLLTLNDLLVTVLFSHRLKLIQWREKFVKPNIIINVKCKMVYHGRISLRSYKLLTPQSP